MEIPCIAFGNKDDIYSGTLCISRIESDLPMDVEVFLGSATTGKNLAAVRKHVLSVF